MPSQPITQLLERVAQGEAAAVDELMPMIYDRLRAIAHRQLVGVSGPVTLSTTALVNEAYLALFDQAKPAWSDRGHFFSYAAKAMRSLLIDRARRRLADKRGGAVEPLDVAEIEIRVDDECLELLALDQALTRIAVEHPRCAQVVELRFFAGLSVEDTAASLSVTTRSVERDWQKARAFINQQLGRSV